MRILYAATCNSNLTDGSGHDVIIGLFTKLDDAKEAARGWGVMGIGDGDVYTIPIFNSFIEYTENQPRNTGWKNKEGYPVVERHSWFQFTNKIPKASNLTNEELYHAYKQPKENDWWFDEVIREIRHRKESYSNLRMFDDLEL